MAVTEIITLQTDASGAITGIEEVTSAMENLDTATVTAEQATVSLKTKIREATNELLNMAEDDPRRQKLIQEIGQMRDRMADTAEAIRGNTGPAVEGITNSFAILQSQLMTLDFAGIGQSLTQMGAAFQRITFAELSQALSSLATGFANLATNVLSNPWGIAAAAAVATLVYWDELISTIDALTFSVEETNKEMLKSEQVMSEMKQAELQAQQIEILTSIVQDHTKSEEDRQDALDKVNYALEQNGIATVDDINNTGALIQAKEILIQKLKAEALARGKLAYLEELQGKLFKMEQEAAAGQDYSLGGMFKTAAMSSLQMGGAEFMRQKAEMDNIKKQIETVSKSIAEDQLAVDKLQIKGFEYKENKKTEIQKKGNKERKENNEKAKQEAEQDLLAELEEWERAKEREIDMTAEIESEGAGKSLKMREIDFSSQMNFVNKKIELKKVETKTLEDIEAKAEDIRRARIKKEMDFRIQQTAEALTVLSDLNDTFTSRNDKVARKQFAVSKALNMAAAIMNTYGAVNKALNDETMPSTAARIVQAVIVGATGFANVAKIAKTQYSSTNTGGGGGGGLGNMSAGGGNMPTAPAVDFGFLQQTGQPNTVETYVLAGNVANALEARQKIIDQSYL